MTKPVDIQELEALFRLGNTQFAQRDFRAACASFRRLHELAPENHNACYNYANVLNELGDTGAAIAQYDRAIELNPGFVAAYANRGTCLQKQGEPDRAIIDFDKAVALNAQIPVIHFNRGNALSTLARFDAALASYDRAIALEPRYAAAHANRGNALLALARTDAACASFEAALAIHPDYAEAHSNRGIALTRLGRVAEAIASTRAAIRSRPDFAEAHFNLGVALYAAKDLPGALASYAQAIELNAAYAAAWLNRGQALAEMNRLDEAVANYDAAIGIHPHFAEAHANRGNALLELKRLPEAVTSFARALELNPVYDYIVGTQLHARMQMCDWVGFDDSSAALLAAIRAERKASPPFPVLSLIDSPVIHRQAASTWMGSLFPARAASGSRAAPELNSRIRIGYFSADFHNHATAYLIAGLFEAHDRNAFELFAFSFGPAVSDEMSGRIRAQFTDFIEVNAMSDEDVAKLARQLRIDIAVDLKGITQGARSNIFAWRAAPIQVNYLGYPGTMAAPYYDYIVADAMLIPDDDLQYYSEKVVRLPGSYQVNDSRRAISQRMFTRTECGLPEDAFVFCCFNNNYKITPTIFGSWMRILREVPHSVLWLMEDNAHVAENLRREAALRDVDPQRLHFAARMPLQEHLARHSVADLFLDTLPYNAHTTASDALWAGLPVLTRIGASFPARVAASLLAAVDLTELITQSMQDYEALAIELANNPPELRMLKQRLQDNRRNCSLFDTELCTRNIESAYRAMFARLQAGLPPASIDVNSG